MDWDNKDGETGSQRSPAKIGERKYTIAYMIQNEGGATAQLRQKETMNRFKPEILKEGETLTAYTFPNQNTHHKIISTCT